MQMQPNERRRAHNRHFMEAVRSTAGKINQKVQSSEHLKLKVSDIYGGTAYLPATHAKAALRDVPYFCDQLVKRLRRNHNLCVVPVNGKLFTHVYPMDEILSFSVPVARPFVSYGPGKPYLGMYVSISKDGSLFAAYEMINGERQIGSRWKAFASRADAEASAKRLSTSASKAVVAYAKDLAHELTISANAIQRRLF